MWAHQYNQEPNQVEVSLHRKPWTTDGPESNLYGLEPNFGCCAANFHQGWPKLASSLWMATQDGGLVAAVYAPCEVHTVVRNTSVQVMEETEYPFRGTIKIRINPTADVRFPPRVRIPLWATGATLRVNGQLEAVPAIDGFATIDRSWRIGDVVDLDLPMAPRLLHGFNNSISLIVVRLSFRILSARTGSSYKHVV